MAKKPIKVTEVVLRDAHQSLLATRMTMDEMRPILPEMDKINYFSVECWGGATFDSCIRFLDEDPWERLRILRKELPLSLIHIWAQSCSSPLRSPLPPRATRWLMPAVLLPLPRPAWHPSWLLTPPRLPRRLPTSWVCCPPTT